MACDVADVAGRNEMARLNKNGVQRPCAESVGISTILFTHACTVIKDDCIS